MWKIQNLWVVQDICKYTLQKHHNTRFDMLYTGCTSAQLSKLCTQNVVVLEPYSHDRIISVVEKHTNLRKIHANPEAFRVLTFPVIEPRVPILDPREERISNNN